MKYIGSAIALLLTVISTSQPPAITAITGVTVIDVVAGRGVADRTVVVTGDRITRMGPRAGFKVPPGARVVDGGGKFLAPGLWDMHGHLFSNSHKPGTDDHAWHFPLYVATGVTGMRDMWTNLDEIPVVRRWEAERTAGAMLAPYVAVTGPMLNGADGILRNVIVITSADEARRAVDRLADGGAVAVKIHSRLPREAYFALMARANERRIPVVGHVPAPITLREAIRAGQHSIEHSNGVADGCASEKVEAEATRLREQNPAAGRVQRLILDGYDDARCADLMRQLAAARIWVVPTLADAQVRLAPGERDRAGRPELRYVPQAERDDWDAGRPNQRPIAADVAEARRQTFLQQRRFVGMMQRAGVPLLVGTDVSNPWIVPGFSVHDELAFFVDAGLTPAEALRAATLAPARYVGMTDTRGTIAAGKFADMVLLDANPLADIRNTRTIRAVFLNGRYLDRTFLDGLLADLERGGR
jgi:imidazolonepropionase-like amidohydrolase